MSLAFTAAQVKYENFENNDSDDNNYNNYNDNNKTNGNNNEKNNKINKVVTKSSKNTTSKNRNSNKINKDMIINALNNTDNYNNDNDSEDNDDDDDDNVTSNLGKFNLMNKQYGSQNTKSNASYDKQVNTPNNTPNNIKEGLAVNQQNYSTVDDAYEGVSHQNTYSPYQGTSSNINSNSELLKKLDNILHLLEEQHEEKASYITEELILYVFLGVFIIYVLDSFVRIGKYVR